MDILSVTSAPRQIPQESWYLVQCKPRQDARAQDNLLRQGYECVRPMCVRQEVIKGSMQSLSESLFPGYLFINLPYDTSWAPLRSTRGVARIVSFGGKPLAVRASLVAELKSRVIDTTAAPLKAGVTVKFQHEEYADLDAVFLGKDGEERVILLINILNRQQQVSVPLASIALG
mgnify:CR=1 FL=1